MPVSMDDRALRELDVLRRAVNRAGKEFRKELRDRVKSEIEEPLAARIRAAANGPHGRLAARTVSVSGGATPAIWLGKGSGVAAAVALGSEFGGQYVKRRLVVQRSRSGNRYAYRRRTTMQFRPHVGFEGYWFVPTMRREFPTTLRKTIEITEDIFSSIPYVETTGGIR